MFTKPTRLPTAATTAQLPRQVGALMMENLLDINWADVQHALPAFLTIALIPLTYSIGGCCLGHT